MEPRNPRNGEAVTIHGSVYNAGIIPTGKISDVVTIGYVVNDELVEIGILENVLPGIENGVEISSGSILDAILGKYTVTVIVNYHDTLSHLRDNPGNNIVQKVFQIGMDTPTIIDSDVYQRYNDRTKNQEVTIVGDVTNIFQDKLENQEIFIDIEGIGKRKTTTDSDGTFSAKIDIPYENKPIKILTYTEGNVLPISSQLIFPLKLNDDQSAIALKITSVSDNNNFDYSTLTMVLFQDSYENLFNKITLNEHKLNQMEDILLAVVPGNHEYIAEIYIDGKIVDAFQVNIRNGEVVEKETYVSESAQLQFRVIDEFGEPQNNVIVENWVYSATSNEGGLTNWIDVLPTISANDPYAAKATFPDGTIVWSEQFLVEPEEKKVIQITKRNEK